MSIRRAALSLLLVVAALAAPAAADTGTTRDIEVAPPPVHVEIMPALRVGHVWAPGYWRWNGKEHVWVPGRWIEERRGYRWVPDHWEQKGSLYHFSRGYWQPTARAPGGEPGR